MRGGAGRRRQRGAGLMVFAAVLVLGVSWAVVSRVRDMQSDVTAVHRNQNAAVLNRAKQALLGHIAQKAADIAEVNPGAFPCPEFPSGFTSTTGFDGRAQTPSCALPAVGRFPWRTLGTDKLVDAEGEALWYALAAGWSKPGPAATDTTVINSNCTDSVSAMACWTGQLTVDGQANAAVAIIIAPGRPMQAAAAAGCAAWNQVRPANANPPDWRNYLECANADDPADATFVTTGSSGSFNDQVVTITAAEALVVIEAAVADRLRKQVAPLMQAVYPAVGPGSWASGLLYPFAAPFGDPTVDPTRKMRGTAVLSTGTASVTNGSTAVTLSAAPATSIAGRHFRVQGSADAYRIGTHVGGTTALTLDSPFTGASSGAAAYYAFAAAGMLPASYAFAGPCACGPAPCVCPTPAACNPGDARCDPGFVAWTAASVTRTGGINLHASSGCAIGGSPSTITCTLNTSMTLLQFLAGTNWVTFNIDAAASNVGMAWRKLNAPAPPGTGVAATIGGIDTTFANAPIGYNVPIATLNADGSATVQINARANTTGGNILGVLGALTCNIFGIPLCHSKTVTVPMTLLGDHDVVDPTNAATNWFFRNRWHEVAYYAVAPNLTTTAPAASHTCATSNTCLQLTHHPDAGKHRALIALGGRKLGTQARPVVALADLLEGANADGGTPFETRSAALVVNRSFNDRFAVIDANP